MPIMAKRKFSWLDVPSFIPKGMRRVWLREFRENIEILELPEYGAWALACRYVIGQDETEKIIGPRRKFTREKFARIKRELQ